MCTSECKTMYGSPRIVYHYEKPMLAVVKTANDKDGRVTTLMRNVGNEKAITSYNSSDTYQKSELYQLRADSEKYKEYKRKSLVRLKEVVK
jgi:hypothetical protein